VFWLFWGKRLKYIFSFQFFPLVTWHLVAGNVSPTVYSLWGLSLMVQRFENHVTVSLGSVHDVWAPPVVWHSLGPELCGLHVAALLCSRIKPSLNLPWHLFMIVVAAFEAFDSKGLHWLCPYVILRPEANIPQCLFGPVWMNSPPSSSSEAVP